VSITLHFLNTVILFWFFFALSLIKLLKLKIIVYYCNILLNWFGSLWISINNIILSVTKNINLETTGLEGLSTDEWYLVISNHKSWADILILQKIFNRRIPFLKFFLKKELIWVPFLGIAWWGLDFPFMKRYSKAFLKKFPHLKGKDIEITRRACEKFRHTPVSVMNFVEGTRFTVEKHAKQKSPFANLLLPRAGGISFVLSAMGGGKMRKILDVTISYSDGIRSFWEFLCGRVSHVRVHVEEIPITDDLIGDYDNDEAFRESFQSWLNALWIKKDERLKATAM
jgi:1-acyl-sn-glycerol-3-phosphate acyltransferase